MHIYPVDVADAGIFLEWGGLEGRNSLRVLVPVRGRDLCGVEASNIQLLSEKTEDAALGRVRYPATLLKYEQE